VLEVEGLKPSDLKLPGLRRPFFGEAERPLFVRAEGFELSAREPDEMAQGRARIKRTVRFDLPRGAYATVVLRAVGQ
jgi:tRNA(Glu) U13 pseudouridine synthase TruD